MDRELRQRSRMGQRRRFVTKEKSATWTWGTRRGLRRRQHRRWRGAAAKTSRLGYYDKRPTAALEARGGNDGIHLKITWGSDAPLQWTTVAGLVDSTKKTKRAQWLGFT